MPVAGHARSISVGARAGESAHEEDGRAPAIEETPVSLMLALTADERAAIGRIVSRYPGLASAVHAHVTRLIQAAMPSTDDTIATEAHLDELLLAVIERV